MNPRNLTICLLLSATLAGCIDSDEEPRSLDETEFRIPDDMDGPLPAADIQWPDFSGRTLSILDHGAFAAFDSAAERFSELTGAEVEHMEADDTGSALNRAMLDRGDPQFDILYGIDNALLWKAVAENVFEPYTPQLGPRVDPQYVFFDARHWPATPVDHGYIALNVDSDHDELEQRNVTIDDLDAVREHADLFVTQDPRTSTPGLGFLLITIGVFGEQGTYTWQDYWHDLLDGDALVTSGWTEAYTAHFSGGYGIYTEGHIGDRPIVTSYTESPAVEVYFESFSADERADVVLGTTERPATFHQIQTMAILKGTHDLALAQAWIEFTLTDDFQELAAPENAVYPVVASVSTDHVYGGLDPEPGTFPELAMDWRAIGMDLDRWLEEWTDLCEAHDCI